MFRHSGALRWNVVATSRTARLTSYVSVLASIAPGTAWRNSSAVCGMPPQACSNTAPTPAANVAGRRWFIVNPPSTRANSPAAEDPATRRAHAPRRARQQKITTTPAGLTAALAAGNAAQVRSRTRAAHHLLLQLRKHLAHLRAHVVAIRALEGLQVGAVPAAAA